MNKDQKYSFDKTFFATEGISPMQNLTSNLSFFQSFELLTYQQPGSGHFAVILLLLYICHPVALRTVVPYRSNCNWIVLLNKLSFFTINLKLLSLLLSLSLVNCFSHTIQITFKVLIYSVTMKSSGKNALVANHPNLTAAYCSKHDQCGSTRW